MKDLGYTMKAATRKESNIARITVDLLCHLRAIQGHPGGIPIVQN